MSLRIFTEPQQGATYDELLGVARATEEGGFDAFFRSDHVLKMGATTGSVLVSDAWTTLAGLARDTSRIRLGTLVTPVTFRHLGMFAVQVAQIDQMSGGRVDVGLGAGWYDAEHTAFGLPFPDVPGRFDLLEDQVRLVHALGRTADGDHIELAGRTGTFSIDAATVKPAQPHLPIVLGGAGGPRAARLAAAYADEYNVPFTESTAMKAVHDKVRAACEAADRDPATMTFSAGQVVCCGRDDTEIERRAKAIGREVDELRKNGLTGTPQEVIDKLGRYAAAGATRCYLQVLDMTDLDHVALLASEVLPHSPMA